MPDARDERILAEWKDLSANAPIPERAPTRRSRTPTLGWGTVAAVVVVLAIAGVKIGATGQGPTGVAVASESASASAEPAFTGSIGPSTAPSVTEPPATRIADGSCSADQLAFGGATTSGFYATLGREKVGVTQPFTNTGDACELRLPGQVLVTPAGGSPEPVDVTLLSNVSSFAIKKGQRGTIELTAIWSVGAPVPGHTDPPCNVPIRDVVTVEVPLASGSLQINLEPQWREVCSSPASVTLTAKV